jgi:DNA polymerase III delta subunit
MKIYLIHGDHREKSYSKLNEYLDKGREKEWKIINIKGNNSFLKEPLLSTDLFDKNRIYVSRSFSKLSKKDIEFLNNYKEKLTGVLIFYSETKISDSAIEKINNIDRVEEFLLPKIIFSFLESFFPKNSNNCLKLYHSLLTNEKIEFIFYLLSKHLRDLYWVSKYPSKIPYPSWRVEKLEKQASRFKSNSIKELINLLSDIDIKSKTSASNLVDLLDFLIITKLE